MKQSQPNNKNTPPRGVTGPKNAKSKSVNSFVDKA